MDWLTEMSVEMVRKRIERSNQNAGVARQGYLHGENRAIEEDYEFLKCGCAAACSCRRRGCRGHYIIRDMGFEQFLSTYVRLWIPPAARTSVIGGVLHGSVFDGRQRNAIPPLRWLMGEWKSILSVARARNKCGLCEDAHPFEILVGNLYQAKMWSQLFYDSLVPFDTASRASIMRKGYSDPFKSYTRMNKELFRDLETFASRHSMDMAEIRGLDSPWKVIPDLHPAEDGQPLSRVIDKIFYSVKPSQEEHRDSEGPPLLVAEVA